jgi:hypothetical protein
MSDGSFSLWCVNDSNSAGKVCIYQDPANVTATGSGTLSALAWLVTGINPGVTVQFIWNVAYDLVWYDNGTPSAEQVVPSQPGAQAVLSHNDYGYVFSAQSSGTSGQLTVKTDGSIPVVNAVVAGIGMDGAGSFGFPALPNVSDAFTPAASGNLAYWVTFGYSGSVGEPLIIANLNAPARFAFPYGATAMTATYQVDGTWAISNGAPAMAMSSAARVDMAVPTPTVLIYRPGSGLGST